MVDRCVCPKQPIGRNTLAKYVQIMFEEARIPRKGQHRNISNHSGKVTCCSTMSDAGFDEQAICMCSGHWSDAVRNYKQPAQRMLHPQ